MALTPDKLEVYENGQEFITYNITSDIVDERMFDCHVKITPADHETRHNRHTGQDTRNKYVPRYCKLFITQMLIIEQN
jgi:hypothetical protein